MAISLGLESKSIAIIGCGWLGEPFARSLIERGYRVIATRSTLDHVEQLRSHGIDAIRLALRPEIECDNLDSLRGFATAVVLLAPGIRTGRASEFPDRISNLTAAL
ncbi:MAG: NAD(P)-binding domain-containing protein, partial [Methylococcales bacterium]